MAGIDKQESILLIEHAISGFKNSGQKQAAVAEFLGIPESRISEAKTGTWRMLSSHKKLIIEKFGGPRQGKGLYVQAELYSNVGEFIEQFHVVGDKRFYQRLIQQLNCEDYLREALRGADNLAERSADMSTRINAVNEFIGSEQFSTWFNCQKASASELEGIEPAIDKWKNHRTSGFYHIDDSMSRFFYKIGLVKFRQCQDFQLGDAGDDVITIKELIVSGISILDETLNLRRNDRTRSKLDIPNCLNANRNLVIGKSEEKVDLDHWDEVGFRLYLSENMRYHTLIELTPHKSSDDMPYAYDKTREQSKRTIVIEDLDHTTLYEEIDKLRQFFGGERSFEADIKREIAANGGYVAGARRL